MAAAVGSGKRPGCANRLLDGAGASGCVTAGLILHSLGDRIVHVDGLVRRAGGGLALHGLLLEPSVSGGVDHSVVTPSLGVRLRSRIARIPKADELGLSLRRGAAIVTLRLLRAQYVGVSEYVAPISAAAAPASEAVGCVREAIGLGLVAPVPPKCILASVIGSRRGTNIGSVELTT
jgi:hypothetical protein